MSAEESASESFFAPAYVQALAGWLGIPPKLFELLPGEGDWAFVIRLHAMIEASLNHMVTLALGDERLSEFVAFMETGDRSTGKLAVVKALDLLPSGARQFLTIFGRLRNKLVHDVTRFDFSFEKWASDMDTTQRKTFKESTAFALGWFSDPDIESFLKSDMLSNSPRLAVLFPALAIMGMALHFSTEKFLDPVRKEEKRLEGLIASYKAGKSQSTPKES